MSLPVRLAVRPQLASYYGSTAFNPSFSRYLNQWAPTTFSAVSIPLLLLLFALVWLLGAGRRSYTGYERWLLMVAVAVGLLALRNWPFASLIAIMLVPVGLDRALRRSLAAPAPGSPR